MASSNALFVIGAELLDLLAAFVYLQELQSSLGALHLYLGSSRTMQWNWTVAQYQAFCCEPVLVL